MLWLSGVMTSSGYQRFEGLCCFYPEDGGSMFLQTFLPASRLLSVYNVKRNEVANFFFSVGAEGI
jgi:hypothetical protein